MKNYSNHLRLVILALGLFSGCNEDESPDLVEDDQLMIQLIDNPDLGQILVDQNNQSIYFFAGDVAGESTCTGGCAAKWPAVLEAQYDLEISTELDLQDFGSIDRADGQKQLTYKGWPLYYFSPESDGVLESAGLTLGDGAGGAFHIAKPDYSVLLARQIVVEGADPITYLVDDRGVSLYLNNGDGDNTSNCNGGCAGVWPPFKTFDTMVLPSSLNQYDFSSTERQDELGPQLSFNGSPLYFFSNDEQKPGLVLGQAGGPNQSFFVTEPTLN
jgi:predicted lipoprotein with Yx(FWY)xxD motif